MRFELRRKAPPVPQFLGTAATAQVVAEALGMAIPHSALAPSGQSIWIEMAKQSTRAVMEIAERGICMKDILSDASIRNAMIVHAAFGGSTNLLLHLPAIAHAAGLRVPTAQDWAAINRSVPRLVSVLPNGPIHHPTVRVFLAGGVPEVMLHLRRLGLIEDTAVTATGQTWGSILDVWETSPRRLLLREHLKRTDMVDPDTVIFSPAQSHERGITSTVTFISGNVAPEGGIVKSTAIDSDRIDANGIFRHTGAAKVFSSEKAAMQAIKSGAIKAYDVMVLMGRGPAGSGMEETYQLTSALKHLSFGKYVSLLTDARFSGVSTGVCIGHIGPEALSGGPIGKLRDGDILDIYIDCKRLEGHVNFVGTDDWRCSPLEGSSILAARPQPATLSPDPELPDDTRLWAALQSVSGGAWRGSVYDVDRIIKVLEAGKEALGWT